MDKTFFLYGMKNCFQSALLRTSRQPGPGLAKKRRGAVSGLAPRVSGRKERLGTSGPCTMRMREPPPRRRLVFEQVTA